MTDALYGLEETLEREHHLVYTPLEGCQDLFVHGDRQALLMIMFSQTPLSHTMFLLLVHHLHPHPPS